MSGRSEGQPDGTPKPDKWQMKQKNTETPYPPGNLNQKQLNQCGSS